MKAEIVTNNDENFNIQVKKFGEQYLASDGERVVIGVDETAAVEGVVELQEQNKIVEEVPVEPQIVNHGPKPVPLEGHRSSNSTHWFEGTSWSTKN